MSERTLGDDVILRTDRETDLPADVTTPATLDTDGVPVNGTLGRDDDRGDFYAVSVEAGQTLRFALFARSLEGSNLTLYAADGTTVLAQTPSVSGQGELTHVFDTAGTYYIGVEMPDDVQARTYRYSLVASPPNTATGLSDVLVGTSGDDVFTGTTGSDVISAGEGDDIFRTDFTEEFTTDVGVGLTNLTEFDGGEGYDTLALETPLYERVQVRAVDGTFEVAVRRTDDSIIFDGGLDITTFQTRIVATNVERIDTGLGADFFYLETLETDIHIETGGGNDAVFSGGGNDTIRLGDGNDYVRLGGGQDDIDGGAGDDRISFYNVAATRGVVADLRIDTIVDDGFGGSHIVANIEWLGNTTRFVDVLDGDAGANFLWVAGAGDTARGHGGDDDIRASAAGTYDGGTGIDTLEWVLGETLAPDLDVDGQLAMLRASEDVAIDLGSGSIENDGFGGSGTAANFENVLISDAIYSDAFRDLSITVDGSDADNEMISLSERDVYLSAGGGDDVIRTGIGNDTVSAGAGDDLIETGFGHDTLLLDGQLSDYDVTDNGDRTYSVTDRSGAGGTDVIRGVEILRDSSGATMTLDAPPIRVGGTLPLANVHDMWRNIIEDLQIVAVTEIEVTGTLAIDVTGFGSSSVFSGFVFYEVVIGGSDFASDTDDAGTITLTSGRIESYDVIDRNGVTALALSDVNVDVAYLEALRSRESTESTLAVDTFVRSFDMTFSLSGPSFLDSANLSFSAVPAISFAGDDIFNLDPDADHRIFAGDGDDVINAGYGRDRLQGGEGDDLIRADVVIPVDPDAVVAQVYRAYRAVFDRAPDAGGLEAYSRALTGGVLTQADMVAEFVASAEFQLTYGALDNPGFMEQLYRNVLGREGDATGIRDFTAVLDAGRSRTDVVVEFANTPEFVARVDMQTRAFLSTVALDPIEAQVYRLYLATLDRVADASGFEAYVGAISTGALTLEQAAEALMASDEFFFVNGRPSDAGFVEALYAHALPDNADPDGRAAFVAALEAGLISRAEAVVQIVTSAEFQLRTDADALAFARTVFSQADDYLEGGAGEDILFGGRGADIFAVDPDAAGSLTILDFLVGVDSLLWLGEAAVTVESLTSATLQMGNDVRIVLGATTVVLENVALDAFAEAGFGGLLEGEGTSVSVKPVVIPVAEASDLWTLSNFDDAAVVDDGF